MIARPDCKTWLQSTLLHSGYLIDRTLSAAKTTTTATPLRSPRRASAARGRSSKGSVAAHGRGSKRASR